MNQACADECLCCINVRVTYATSSTLTEAGRCHERTKTSVSGPATTTHTANPNTTHPSHVTSLTPVSQNPLPDDDTAERIDHAEP